MKIIPAGITWERVTNDTSIVTIRYEPEIVYEVGDILNASHRNAIYAGAQNHICDQHCGGMHGAMASNVMAELFW